MRFTVSMTALTNSRGSRGKPLVLRRGRAALATAASNCRTVRRPSPARRARASCFWGSVTASSARAWRSVRPVSTTACWVSAVRCKSRSRLARAEGLRPNCRASSSWGMPSESRMARHRPGFFQKVQLFPLNVFDQGQNGALHIISGHDDGLRPGSAQFFQGPQPPFSGDELVFSRAHPPNQQR